ncbi:hypothetical protein K435DRAFT_971083 [Dendrothele bispora CBS 962.96]|uniref:Uncharacterized protein n=1 Tax=Dendrothele bispora (strain CBS 962.96) TaxID=1314807 RepID=A0A4S8L842_DENBC|nr:hypothetical protein K435DRAFT_971083 [Dendrothele bispora CBS 962.96]
MSTASGKPLSFPALVCLLSAFGVLICVTLSVGFSMFYYSADFHRSVDLEKQLQLKQTENYPLQKTTTTNYVTRSKPPRTDAVQDGLVDVKGIPPPPQRPVSHRSDAVVQSLPTLKKNDPPLSSGAPGVGDRMTREEAEAVLAKYRWLKQKERATKQRLMDAGVL